MLTDADEGIIASDADGGAALANRARRRVHTPGTVVR
jgi:hypothetical protein